MAWICAIVAGGTLVKSAAPLLDRAAVRAEFERHHDEVVQCNKLDLEFYEFVLREMWPRQVVEYGKDRRAGHVATAFADGKPSIRSRLRLGANFALRNLVYSPGCGWTVHSPAMRHRRCGRSRRALADTPPREPAGSRAGALSPRGAPVV
jgi:hypothetical protein